MVYEDKSLYKAKGGVWHQKDRKVNHIPKGLRALDKDASWSTSPYRGWVYGYGLHLTTTVRGFPLLALASTVSMSEKAGLDQNRGRLVERNIGYLVADAGYTDFKRVETFADNGLWLLPPFKGAKKPKIVGYLQAVNNSEPLVAYQKNRKTAIEPVFALLREFGTHANQKQLPVSRIENVRPFLMLAVVLLQLAMLVNLTWNLPFRNVSWMITVFR